LDASGSVDGSAAGSHEHNNRTSSSKRVGECFYLSDY